MIARRLLALLVLVLSVVVLDGCTEEVHSEPGDAADPAADRPPSPRREGEAPDRSFSTHLYSERDADVHSGLGPASGEGGLPVDSIAARIGDRVDAGDLLAVLDEDEARLAVAEARPPYRAAAAEHERLQELHARDAASEVEVERARFEEQRRKAALDRAELRLERTRVRAPFDGVVARRYVQVGKRVTESTPLFRVTALRPLRARLLVPEEREEGFRAGDSVTVRGVDGDTATARVVVVGPTIDPASGTREVIVQLIDPRGFRPGASVVVMPRDTGRGDRSGREPTASGTRDTARGDGARTGEGPQ